MAEKKRRSRRAGRDGEPEGRQALPATRRATACRQSRAARRRRRAAADRAPSRHRLTRSKMSCHAAVAALIAIADQLLSKSNCRRWVRNNRRPLALPPDPSQRCSPGFLSDAFADGRRFRIPAIVDVFTRECLALVADTSLPSLRVARELGAVIIRRGRSAIIVSNRVEP